MPANIPTKQSQGQPLDDLVTQGANLLASVRAQAVTWKANMVAGPVNAEVIEQIASYMSDVLPKFQDMKTRAGFNDLYARMVGPSFQDWDMASINATANRIIGLPDHSFVVDDRIVIRRRDGTIPTGLAFDTNYWVVAINVVSEWIQVSTTEGGSVIGLTDDGSGRADILFNVQPVLGAITDAGSIVAIQTELEAMDKVDASGWHQARKIDDTQPDGFSHNTYSSVETATLQTKLQDLIDDIRAPV